MCSASFPKGCLRVLSRQAMQYSENLYATVVELYVLPGPIRPRDRRFPMMDLVYVYVIIGGSRKRTG